MVYYFLSPDESSGACGLLAQLVEHIVHIDGVTGSSPVRTTMKSSYLAKGKSFLFCFEKRIEMKLFRYRKPSMKTALGITKVKRAVARATGIPTTKAGRKRKALNAVTGGAYGKAQRARAAVNRPIKRAKHPATCIGCIVWVLSVSVGICVLCLVLF